MAIITLNNLPQASFTNSLTGNEPLITMVNGQTVQIPSSAVGGGGIIDSRSSISGYCSTIVAATSSRVIGNRSAVIGGFQNFTNGNNSAVIAGSGNDINSNYSGNLIVGGFENNIYGTPLTGMSSEYYKCEPKENTILGGMCNTIEDGQLNGVINSSNSIIGGLAPQASNIIGSDRSFVCTAGGQIHSSNTIIGSFRTSITSAGCIPGGAAKNTHTIHDKNIFNSAVLGGCCNTIVGSDLSVILGGSCNSMILIDKEAAPLGGNSMIGGFKNSLSGKCNNSIFGGLCNCILSGDQRDVIISGTKNKTGQIMTDKYHFGPSVESVIVGGQCNRAHIASTVIGGNTNYTFGYRSTVIGGSKNCINVCDFDAAGTYKNIGAFTGQHSTIAGGLSNTITTSAAFIAGGLGNKIKVGHDHSAIIGTGITSVSGCMLHANTLFLSADALPTADPGLKGVVWRSGTDLKISIG